MSIKANLRILLLANDVTVAESTDAALWQLALATITGQRGVPDSSLDPMLPSVAESPTRATKPQQSGLDGNGTVGTALAQFAQELRLDLATVRGACDPSTEPPYLHLDGRAWQEFKRKTPARGNNSVP